MWDRANSLSKINRSIAGPGIRKVLNLIKSDINNLTIHSVPSGTKCFDWEVPKEWNFKRATIKTINGDVIVDTDNNPLHVVMHSIPKKEKISLNDLKSKLHTNPQVPHAIPYVTSYYKDDWGFCLTENQLKNINEIEYFVEIDSELKDGYLNYGELLINGKTEKEITISTYICHPYMGNNESSGPALAVELAKAFLKENPYYSMRFLFIPETIGSIAFLSKNLENIKNNCIAGFNITCVGDELNYSFLGTKYSNTIADRAAHKAYKEKNIKPIIFPWSMRGSDERQYCWPNINLPFVSMMRSMYNTYPEYHSSADNMEFITEKGLQESYDVIKSAIDLIQSEHIPLAKTYGEPKLDKINLYRKETLNGVTQDANKYLQVLTYCDGKNEMSYVNELSGLDKTEFNEVMDRLIFYDLIELL